MASRCTLSSGAITPHSSYLELGQDAKERQTFYRKLFRTHLDAEAIDDIRLALSQSLPLGNSRFHAAIAEAMGERREARPRGRPKGSGTIGQVADQLQLELPNN